MIRRLLKFFLFCVRAWQADKKAQAARRSKQKAADDAASTTSPETSTATATDTRSGSVGSGSGSSSSGELRVTQVGNKPKVCGTKTKAGDLIEFRCASDLVAHVCIPVVR